MGGNAPDRKVDSMKDPKKVKYYEALPGKKTVIINSKRGKFIVKQDHWVVKELQKDRKKR